MKENKNKKTMIFMLIITTLVCFIPMIYGLVIWDKLPDQLPTHWNFANEVDDYSPKGFVVFGLPVFLAVLNVMVQVGLSMDPKKAAHSEKIKILIMWMIPILTLIVVPMSFLVGQGMQVDVGFVITVFIGVLFLFIGNYLPKCRQNYTMGIRIPWTLNSEENWNRTHRFAGVIWILGSILIIISSFIGSEILLFPIILIIVLVPMIYSYLLYRKGI